MYEGDRTSRGGQGMVFFEGLKMNRLVEHVAHISMVVDICRYTNKLLCYTVTFSTLILLYLTLRDGKYKVQDISTFSIRDILKKILDTK